MSLKWIMTLQGPLLLNSLPTLKNCPKVKSARILSTVSNLLCLTRSPIVSGCSDQWPSFLIGFDGCSTSEWDTLWCPWLIISCFCFVVRLAFTPFLLALFLKCLEISSPLGWFLQFFTGHLYFSVLGLKPELVGPGIFSSRILNWFENFTFFLSFHISNTNSNCDCLHLNYWHFGTFNWCITKPFLFLPKKKMRAARIFFSSYCFGF